MDRTSRHTRGEETVQFGDLKIASLLFVDDVVLLASSDSDLQHKLGKFTVECKAVGMRLSTSKAMVLRWIAPSDLWVSLCPKWRISGSCSRVRAKWNMTLTGELVRHQQLSELSLKGKAFDLPVDLRPKPNLRSWVLGSDQQNEIANASGQNKLPS